MMMAGVVDVGTADVDHLAWPGWLRQGKFDPRYCYRYRCAGVEAKKTTELEVWAH
jgi:hypothetical protein